MLDYIVDFYCHELMPAIEVDGDSHSAVEAKDYDLKRQQRLEAYGVTLIRFEDPQMKRNINQAVEIIRSWITERSYTPLAPPQGGKNQP